MDFVRVIRFLMALIGIFFAVLAFVGIIDWDSLGGGLPKLHLGLFATTVIIALTNSTNISDEKGYLFFDMTFISMGLIANFSSALLWEHIGIISPLIFVSYILWYVKARTDN